MTIEYYKRNVYGREHLYIKGDKIAKSIERLTNKKTIGLAEMNALKELGHTFKQVLPE